MASWPTTWSNDCGLNFRAITCESDMLFRETLCGNYRHRQVRYEVTHEQPVNRQNWSGSGEAAAHPRSATVAPFPAWRVCSLAIARRPEPDKRSPNADWRLPI